MTGALRPDGFKTRKRSHRSPGLFTYRAVQAFLETFSEKKREARGQSPPDAEGGGPEGANDSTTTRRGGALYSE